MTGIYKIENLINGKIYIGQSIDIKQRWRQHRNDYKNKKSLLYSAINKYGIENFLFSIIEECKEEELNEKECFYIKKFNSCVLFENSHGYNATEGGESPGSSLKDEQKENIIKLWNDGLTEKEIVQKTNISAGTVTRTLKNFLKLENNEILKRGNAYKAIKVYQFTTEGKFIKEFNSISDASSETKVHTVNIAYCCKDKISSAGGYIWSYTKENIDEKVSFYNSFQKHGKRIVAKYDLDGNFICTYKTIKEAMEECGGNCQSNITNALKGRAKTAYGYKWGYIGGD